MPKHYCEAGRGGCGCVCVKGEGPVCTSNAPTTFRLDSRLSIKVDLALIIHTVTYLGLEIVNDD